MEELQASNFRNIYIYISFRRLKGCCFGVVNKQYGPTNKETKFLEHFPNIEEHHMFFFQLSLFFPIFTIESSPIPQYYPILQLYPATMGQNKQSSQLNPSGPPEPHEKLGAIFWGTIWAEKPENSLISGQLHRVGIEGNFYMYITNRSWGGGCIGCLSISLLFFSVMKCS